MLYFTRWKAAAIILMALVVCLCAVPNFFPASVVDSWPKWAQRHIVLGLDLQGGSHILLEVDTKAVRREKLTSLMDDVRRTLRDARIGYTGLVIRGNSVEVRIRDAASVDQALTKLRTLSQPLGGILSATGQNSLDISRDNDLIRLTVTEPAILERVRQSVDQSIQIIDRRVNELGTVEPLIQREGSDRILVQVPGLQDPTRLKQLLGKTAKLDFRMVDTSIPAEQAQGRVPPDDELLYSSTQPRTPYLIEKRVLVSGADLTDAQPGFDQRTSEPIVSFRFNTSGARKFAEATQQNVGKPFAIVLDNEVISAPVIREPILGGSGQISGNFTVQSANDLAILLRAGALPAPLTIIEERTVGPGLGQDSIAKGKLSSYVGAALVVIFMIMTYGLFGVFANIAVAINVAMIFGILSLLNATLKNVGTPFAIVLDNEVISAPVIREPITGGSGQISGGFTVQQANDLAILLRAGALPAPLTIIEERTVGPGLGQDSIEKGERAAYVGSVLVIVFMLLTYRLFGVFANIAVAINVAMIFGVLSLLNATLTLPGIAGIVLTVGIAVDSNVLIYERIREELRAGRNAISAIDAGFKRALATILDSNITTFIAAAVLFYIGTGPVRGFAVTLGIGIITTVFTAFEVTRLIVAGWVRWKRPQTVPI
ncbi:MAG TPA: protein translocase subunit SecD [Xanthobacteraceae bacterium]|nr:protein translocase subunit SecD [Xanthobacteraceae bacterium]